MKIALIVSLVLHIIFISLIGVTVHNPFSQKLKDTNFVVYEFKEIGSKSKAPILSNKEGHLSKEKAQKANKENDNNEKETKFSEPNKPTKNKKDQKEVVIKNKKDKEKIKKKTKPEKKKSTTNTFKNKGVVNLKENKKSTSKKGKKKAFESLLDNAMIATSNDGENSGIKAEEVGEVITATQIDLIRQTIRKCWHFPAGLKNAGDLMVDIRLELAEDGTVKKAEIVDKERMNSDPNFKIAAENAYRAVLDPECNPLPLPKEKYEEWKDLELTFNPKDMFE